MPPPVLFQFRWDYAERSLEPLVQFAVLIAVQKSARSGLNREPPGYEPGTLPLELRAVVV